MDDRQARPPAGPQPEASRDAPGTERGAIVTCLSCGEAVDSRLRPLVLEESGDVLCNPCLVHARIGADWLVDVSLWHGVAQDIIDAGRKDALLDLHPGYGPRVGVFR